MGWSTGTTTFARYPPTYNRQHLNARACVKKGPHRFLSLSQKNNNVELSNYPH